MRPKTALLLAVLAAALLAPASAQAVPRSFFGIAPQTAIGPEDVEHMSAGGIGSVRWPLVWESVQPTADGGFDWSSFDQVMETAALARLRVLPFLYGTPKWLSRKQTSLPIDSARQRRAWAAFVKAAVRRYGPGGEFWTERAPGVVIYQPAIPNPTPVREWQVWNEANFFYFATPASPTRYAKLLKITHRAIKAADPDARVILSGLFAEPTAKPPNAMSALDFLGRLYRVPGIKSQFDGVALHPYADSAARLEEMIEELRSLLIEKHDPGARLYITELGWGSQDDPNIVSFERGVRGQVKELRAAYRYMIANRARLNLKAAYWFSWKDVEGVCNFCDSVGLFRRGDPLRPKPAWRAFVRIAGGRVRP